MKMHKLGMTRKERDKKMRYNFTIRSDPDKSKDNEMVYPSMNAESDEMAPVSELEHGKHYMMTAHIHVPEKTEETKNGKTNHRVKLDFHEVSFEPMTKKKSEDIQDKEDEEKLNKMLEKS